MAPSPKMPDEPLESTVMPEQLKPVLPGGQTWLGRVDPRARLVAALLFSVVVVLADRFEVLVTALVATIAGLFFSGSSPRAVLRRLVPLNVLILVLIVWLPLAAEGAAAFRWGPLEFSAEGLRLAAAIALKGNTVVLAMLVLLGSLDAVALGHALSHLRVPDKLTHLLLFTVRYLDVLRRESLRLSAAMKVRGFRPRMDRHTYRSYGHLAGMLLIRSCDRSERVVAAMKCRGFRGRFYMFDHFHFSRRDLPFCVVSLLILLVLVWMEWA